MNEELQALVVEQYLYWQRHGWTHREMMTACRRPWRITMTGDDVLQELASAWNELEKSMGRRQCYIYPGARGFVGCDDYRWTERDARGIPLTQVCKNCRDAKLSKYRPQVLTNPQYAHDEALWDGQSPHTFQIDEDA